ncbi:hypothetical protein [Marinobacter orientalis]|uniref:Uncharacterized protein n=1 Tax=Marinobacter orientalis TaxID=1928859 RepID=A0A7Y0NJK9_9GAMM|nr:hypothetical protein [Marinobacter orientalis]NMT62194.1 hypothetical protein [Marinobacter orientalis]TGX50911.1 hypothetical protein DIT72_02420 [Marinobacter orientalis]
MFKSSNKVIETVLKAKELILALIVFLGWLSAPFFPDVMISYSTDEFFADVSPNSEGKTIFDIVVENESGAIISDIELAVIGVSNVTSVSYKTSSKRLINEIGDSLSYQISDDGIYFDGLKSIPPGHNFRIQLLGEYSDPVFTSPIKFYSSTTDIYIESKGYVTGPWVFAYEWSYIWVPLIFALLILLTSYRVLPHYKKALEE